jgi:putative restriction endonuclease
VIGEADQRIRLAVFDWLTAQREVQGEALPWRSLHRFTLDGVSIPLVGASGIWTPAACQLPISVTTTLDGPYSDSWDRAGGTLRYAYRGTDPQHRDNRGLRQAMLGRVPIVYFHGVQRGWYAAAYPMFVIRDDMAGLQFTMQFDDLSAAIAGGPRGVGVAEDPEPRRAYVTATVRRRIHQVAFRERVLRAYRERCALCRLRHQELLDAAHIIPDTELEGDLVVSNGLALCKLHHAAFDRFFFAVRPDDFKVEVRRSILEEADGPMLVVGLQQIHGTRIELPRRTADVPDPARLARRYDEFQRASQFAI